MARDRIGLAEVLVATEAAAPVDSSISSSRVTCGTRVRAGYVSFLICRHLGPGLLRAHDTAGHLRKTAPSGSPSPTAASTTRSCVPCGCRTTGRGSGCWPH